MNERFEFGNLREPEIFDRLADGELSAIEERELLTALDTRPDGWRRCALAFLEARAWTDGLEPLVGARGIEMNGAPLNGRHVILSSPTQHSSRAQRARSLAVAASIALAFFLGTFANSRWMQEGGLANPPLAVTDDGISENSPAIADRGGIRDSAGVHVAAKPALTMSLVDNQGDVERQFSIPVVEAEGLNPAWLARHPAAMSPQEVEALEHRGYRVDQERLYVPVLLGDGRQAIVSFDRAAVKYNGVRF
jgi:hypothetical protein